MLWMENLLILRTLYPLFRGEVKVNHTRHVQSVYVKTSMLGYYLMRLCKLMYCGGEGRPLLIIMVECLIEHCVTWSLGVFSTDIPLLDFPFSSLMPQVTFVWCLTCVRHSAPS